MNMALCTKCGAILHDEDTRNHLCTPADVPAKGQVKKPNVITEAIQK